MYVVRDSYGTCKFCWTYAAALEWLAFTSPSATIRRFLTNTLIARRRFA